MRNSPPPPGPPLEPRHGHTVGSYWVAVSYKRETPAGGAPVLQGMSRIPRNEVEGLPDLQIYYSNSTKFATQLLYYNPLCVVMCIAWKPWIDTCMGIRWCSGASRPGPNASKRSGGPTRSGNLQLKFHEIYYTNALWLLVGSIVCTYSSCLKAINQY